MRRHLGPIAALLFGSGLLLFAGGMNSLLLPLRGEAEGFSTLALGLLGTGWAIGFVTGCLVVAPLVGRVGHIRSFSVMASLASVAVLMSLLLLTPYAWIPLRAISGFCFAGAAMIVESWLNERTGKGDRGKVFGVYTMVNLGASTAGQLLITTGDISTPLFFVVAAMVYSMALVPTAISSTKQPDPLVETKLDIPALWRNSPVAVAAVLLVGMAHSAFGTLGAVYASQIGLSVGMIGLFVAAPVLAGALVQVPIGAISDRTDRRYVLIGVAFTAMLAGGVFVFFPPTGPVSLIALAIVFGAAMFTCQPVAVAHANDHAAEGTFVRTSGGLLLVFGVGAILGPLIAGFAMSQVGTVGLFSTTMIAHALMVLYTIWRVMRRAPVPAEGKTSFVAAVPPRNSTPQTATLVPERQPVIEVDELETVPADSTNGDDR